MKLSELALLVDGYLSRAPRDELYNEFSLQHELGFFLRSRLSPEWRVQFERPAGHMLARAVRLGKKEIDLVVCNLVTGQTYAIELKCPRSGQHPEQMFKACCDLAFLEALVSHGLSGGLFVMHVIDPLFFERGVDRGIYGHFRAGAELTGCIMKPTGKRNTNVTLTGRYSIHWRTSADGAKYFIQHVEPAA